MIKHWIRADTGKLSHVIEYEGGQRVQIHQLTKMEALNGCQIKLSINKGRYGQPVNPVKENYMDTLYLCRFFCQ